jgi:carbamoylphosphate synthase large subunit
MGRRVGGGTDMSTLLLGNRADWREYLAKRSEVPVPKKKHFWKRRDQPAQALERPTPFDVSLAELPLNEDTIKSDDIDFILPCCIPEYALLNDCLFAQDKCVFPDVALANSLDDKMAFNRLMVDLGYSDCIPKVGSPGDLQFPMIKKRRIDEYGIHTRIIKNSSELETCEQADHYFQEYVRGNEEYATHAICVAGSLLYVASYMYVFETDTYSKSASVQPSSVRNLGGYIPSELTNILSDLRYTGCACFNFKLRGTLPLIFELNPRVGSSFLRDANAYFGAYMKAVETNNRQRHGPSRRSYDASHAAAVY